MGNKLLIISKFLFLQYFFYLPLYEDKFGVSIPDLYTIHF